jgi:hypothetical protein
MKIPLSPNCVKSIEDKNHRFEIRKEKQLFLLSLVRYDDTILSYSFPQRGERQIKEG